MSDIQDLRGNLELKKIEAPSLSQSNYGKNIREKFDNIDDNLRRLANRDFVAGKAGKDIKFAKYSLWSDNDFTDLGRTFVQAIVGDELIDWENDWNASVLDFTEVFYDNHKKLSPVSVQDDSKVKFFEYFIENPDITIMYQLDDHEAPDEEANRILICSPYVYTFIDQRYAVLGTYTPNNPNVYSGLEDASCLLNLTYDEENPQLERINQFPTLYYDGNGQFRWKLYGSESGILATGPKGADASSAPITFARLNSSDTGDNTATGLSTSTISQILVVEESTAQWKDVADVDKDKLPKVGDPIMAYRPMTSQGAQDPALINHPYTVYFTKVINVTEDRVISVCDASSTSIQFLVNSTMLDSMLKTIIDGSMGTSCLYVPSIGSLDDFSDASIVHAAIGKQTVESGDPHYYLTLKPIVYGIVGHPEETYQEEAKVKENSKLIIDYGDVEINGNTKLTKNLEVGNNVNISGKLTSTDAEITNTLKTKILEAAEGVKVGTAPRYTQIGGSENTKDRIVLYSNYGSSSSTAKQTILDSESVTTSKVVADNVNVSGEVTANSVHANDSITAKVDDVPGVYLGCPIGTIIMWAGTTEPDGWHMCDGSGIPTKPNYSEISSDTWKDYSNLLKILVDSEYPYGHDSTPYTRIDGTYTAGPHVNLPDLQQKFPLGAKAGSLKNGWTSSSPDSPSKQILAYTKLGTKGGGSEVTLSIQTMPKHAHQLVVCKDEYEGTDSGGCKAGNNNSSHSTAWATPSNKSGSDNANTGENRAHSNMPPYLAINFIIKYK